jgi:hypothetical protein
VRATTSTIAAAVLILASLTSHAATAPATLAKARIALRSGGTRVLIIGEALENDGLAKLETSNLDRLPQLQLNANLSPGEMTFAITTATFRRLAPKPMDGFVMGAKWWIYSGESPPSMVVVEQLVLLYHGDGNQYFGALARFAKRDAERIAGLSRSEFLAIPGPVVPGISHVPLLRLDPPDSAAIAPLLQRAHEVVRDDEWELEGTIGAEEIKRIRNMNHTFRATGMSQTPEIRMWRWKPDTKTSLLLVETVWIAEDQELPLFAVDAIVQELPVPRIVSFDYTKARWMRMGEFRDRDWRLNKGDSAFLNAWKIGSDLFVLTFAAGYEGYGVELQKVDFATGLVAVLAFGQ